MHLDDMDELLGAYALDALDDDERRLVDDYLTTSPRARAEVQQHREVATMLAITGSPAPDGLWDRIASAIEGDPAPPVPGPGLAAVLPRPDGGGSGGSSGTRAGGVGDELAARRHRRRWLAGGAAALIGVAAAVVIGVLAGTVADQHRQIDRLTQIQAQDGLDEAVTLAFSDPSSRRVDLLGTDGRVDAVAVVGQGGTGYLVARDLPALGAEQTYQLWGVLDGKVISLGVLGPAPALVPFQAGGGLSALAITVEEAGGVPVSSQPILLQGELS